MINTRKVNNNNIESHYYNWNGLKNYGSMKNEVTDFENCEFENLKIDLNQTNVKKLCFKNCKGNIEIVGENVNLIIEITNSDFDSFNLQDSKINQMNICSKSKGIYNIKNNKYVNLLYIESSISNMKHNINSLFILPLILLGFNLLFNDFSCLGYCSTIHFMYPILILPLLLAYMIIITIETQTNKRIEIPKFKTSLYIGRFLMMCIIVICTVMFPQYKSIFLDEIQSEWIIVLMFILGMSLFIIIKLGRVIFLLPNQIRQILITNNNINELYLKKIMDTNILKIFILPIINEETISRINIDSQNKIKYLKLENYEGSNELEKVYCLLDKNDIHIESLNNIENIQNANFFLYYSKLYEFKNRHIMYNNDGKDADLIYKIFTNSFYEVMKYFYPIFLRPQKLALSFITYVLIGGIIFHQNNMTINDQTTQIYVKTIKADIKNKKIKSYLNIKNDESSRIYVSDIYPTYFPIAFTISILFPYLGTEDKVKFRANNIKTDIDILIYKILAIIHGSALFVIVGRFFLPKINIKEYINDR